MEGYNQKLEDMRKLRSELTMASRSLLEQPQEEPEQLEATGVTEQLEAMKAVMSQATRAAPVVDLAEGDEDMEIPSQEEEVEFMGEAKKPAKQTFRGAASPQKVAQLHVKTKKERQKEGKDPKDTP